MDERACNSKVVPLITAENRRIVRLFSLVIGSLSLLFAITSLLDGHLQHSLFLFLLTVLLLINLLFLKKSAAEVIPTRVLALVICMLYIELLHTGGINASGIFWFYLYPPFLYYMMGSREATASMLLISLFTVMYLSLVGTPAYLEELPDEMVQRLLASLVAVTIFSYIYERSREIRQEEILRLNQELAEQAGNDNLSGLYNRYRMNDEIKHEHARFNRSGPAFSLIMCDIDFFKRVNDTRGHQAGDRVIQDISCVIRSHMRQQDSAARWGGEEFLLLLPETGNEQAVATAERLRQNIAQNFAGDGSLPGVTVSFGVATIQAGESIDQIINHADQNLYLAKRQGRNCVVA